MELLCGSTASILKLCYVQRINDTLNAKELATFNLTKHAPESYTTSLDEMKQIYNIGDGIILTVHTKKDGKGCTTFLNYVETDKTAAEFESAVFDITCRVIPALSSAEYAIQSVDTISEDRILIGWSNGRIDFVSIGDLETLLRESIEDDALKRWENSRIFEKCRVNIYNPKTAFLCGEKGMLASVIDVENTTEIWRARNVPLDTLNMEVPIWDKDGSWIDENSFTVSTAYGHVRIYDIRAQKRPVLSISLSEEVSRQKGTSKIQQLTRNDYMISLNCIRTNIFSKDKIITSSNRGDMYTIDIRKENASKKGHVLGRFKGIQGAVRDILLSDEVPNTVFATGLDRFLRVYDTNSHVEIGKCYLKFRQSCLSTSSIFEAAE